MIAGTLFQSTHFKLTLWFLAIYLISEAKTGLSSLALMRQLGVSYPTAWLIQQKLMQAMAERDALYTLSGDVQVDDAYLGGELTGGKSGREAPRIKCRLSRRFLSVPKAIRCTSKWCRFPALLANWANEDLSPGCVVLSDGLACFAGVTDAGCQHEVIIAGGRKLKDLPEFNWLNTVLGNLKTSLGGAYHAFDFSKYGTRYLAAFSYRFNRRFHLDTLPMRLILASATIGPRPSLAAPS
ncbi:MAG: IS1595 family transposase [Methyloprofundus sp.]|nr:IS1595 family transposase [Methyloprofundus sp.]